MRRPRLPSHSVAGVRRAITPAARAERQQSWLPEWAARLLRIRGRVERPARVGSKGRTKCKLDTWRWELPHVVPHPPGHRALSVVS